MTTNDEIAAYIAMCPDEDLYRMTALLVATAIIRSRRPAASSAGHAFINAIHDLAKIPTVEDMSLSRARARREY